MFVSCRKNVAVYIFWLQFFGENNFFSCFLNLSLVLGGQTSLGSEESQKHVCCPQNVDFWRKREIFRHPTAQGYQGIPVPNWDAWAGLRPAKHIPMPTLSTVCHSNNSSVVCYDVPWLKNPLQKMLGG